MATTYTRTPAHRSHLYLLAIALFIALLVVVSPSGAGTASSATQQLNAVQQKATIAVLPPISQPGKRVAKATGARTVVTGTFRPKVAGRPAVLERRQGGLWKAVGRTGLDKAGRVAFTAPTRFAGHAATYRVSATAYHGLPGIHSDAVRANAWGQPAFVDEFNGKALGPAWEHRGQAYNPGGGRSASKGDPAAVAVRHGALRLSVLADPARAGERFTTPTGNYAYRLNGHVGTASSFDFQYGVAAARMKFQRARGQHPSFWMQPQGGMGAGAEIDVVEWFGSGGGQQRLATNIYPHPDYETNATWFGGRLPKPDQYLSSRSDHWWTAYHVFSVEWTPSEYVFRIDGHVSMRTTHGVSHHPEYLILSMLSSDYELGYLGGDQHLGQHAYVDWVQAWPQR